MLKQPRSLLIRYLLPFIAVLTALFTQAALMRVLAPGTDFPYAFFYLIAVFVAAWWCGYTPGILACLLTLVGLPYLSTPSFRLSSIDLPRLTLLLAVSLLISWVARSQERAQKILRYANEELDRRVQQRTQELAQAVTTLEAEIVERKKIEQDLRESEARVDFALDAAGLGRWDLDMATFRSDRTLRHDQIFGYEAIVPDWTYEMFLEHVLPSHRSAVAETFRSALEQGRLCEFECPIKRQDGTIRWIWLRGKIRRDDSGKPVRMLGTIGDITDRKLAEHAARQWHQVIQHAGFGVAIVNPQTEILEAANPAFARMHGFEAEELKGRRLADFFAPEEHSDLALQAGRLRQKGHYAFELTHIRRNGTRFPSLNDITALRDEHDETCLWAGYFQDMSAYKEAEEKVRETSERLTSILENISDGFIAVDRDWRHTYINPRAAEMLRQPADQLLGRILWDALPNMIGGPPYKEFLRALNQSVPVRSEFFYEPFKRWFDASAYPTKDGLALFLRDVTERMRLADQLQQAQKMEAVGRLAGGIAHDFNNLLTVISGYADMTFSELPPDSALRETVMEIALAAKRAAEVTGGLLAFSRRQLVQRSVLDLNSVIKSMEKMLRRLIREDIHIVTILTPDLWSVSSDRSQLEQVIMNLAVNARDAMPDGGTLTIETANAELDEAYAREHLGVQPGQYVLVAVSDTGIGIDRETQAHIFEPFFTTKEPGKGTGLGLSTVYGILQQSGGSVSVYSELGRGTTFKIYLPRSTAKGGRLSSEGAPAIEAVRTGGATILLVEDDESLRKLTGTILQRNGFEVISARGGVEALEICGRQSENIDLVLSDMVMPNISGQQLAAEIRRRHPHLRLLFMSGYTENAIANQNGEDLGIDFLSKPFTATGLISKIQEVLGNPQQSVNHVQA